MAARLFLIAVAASLIGACGGSSSSGSSPPPPPPPAGSTFTVNYLRVEPAYDGWGLHLWGSAIDAGVATVWSNPRTFDRIENGAAVFDIPVVNDGGNLNLVVHNGDLKSPVYDISMVPRDFPAGAWIVQDTVASVVNDVAAAFDNEAAALAALSTLGDASASLDLSPVAPIDVDSGLPADWADYASFIEIYVRGYQDSDGDGIGDLQGLISRLDYLAGLGVTGIWLMPVTESADNDHGYAVEDYRAIEQQYGTMADFEQLISEAHARGIAIIIDYVINHSSSTNPLFLDASTSPSNDKRDWYVWADIKPAGWNTFGGDPWRNNGNGWYYGIFTPLMPDFNLRNPDVISFHENNLRFWLNKGVDGFRFDAVGLLFENGPNEWEDAPENHSLLASMRTLIDSYSKRFIVCEAPASPVTYAANTSCGRAFAFQSTGAILNSARGTSVDGNFVNQLMLALSDQMPQFLSNHDSFAGDRVWNQLNGNEDHYRLAAASYLLSARTPFTYYGEEVGLANAAALSGDHALRTPMSWTSDPNTAGFTNVAPFRELSANSTTHNVAVESVDSDSLLTYYQTLLDVRKQYPVIGRGTLDVQSQGGDPLLIIARNAATACAVIAINYSNSQQPSSASSQCTNASFDFVLGGNGSLAADATGTIDISVPPRSAVVLHAAR